MTAYWACELAAVDRFTSSAMSGEPTLRLELGHGQLRRNREAQASSRQLQVLVVGGPGEETHDLAAAIRHRGHTVRIGYEIASAVHMAVAQRPAIVLLILSEWPIDACTIARRLRHQKTTADSFIIAVTSEIDTVRRERWSRAGVDLVLTKPVRPGLLEVLLVLEGERLNRRNRHSSILPKLCREFTGQNLLGSEDRPWHPWPTTYPRWLDYQRGGGLC